MVRMRASGPVRSRSRRSVIEVKRTSMNAPVRAGRPDAPMAAFSAMSPWPWLARPNRSRQPRGGSARIRQGEWRVGVDSACSHGSAGSCRLQLATAGKREVMHVSPSLRTAKAQLQVPSASTPARGSHHAPTEVPRVTNCNIAQHFRTPANMCRWNLCGTL